MIKKVNPNEIYNLAAQSHVKVSFEVPEYSADVNGLGTLRILEAIRSLNYGVINEILDYKKKGLYLKPISAKLILIPKDFK